MPAAVTVNAGTAVVELATTKMPCGVAVPMPTLPEALTINGIKVEDDEATLKKSLAWPLEPWMTKVALGVVVPIPL